MRTLLRLWRNLLNSSTDPGDVAFDLTVALLAWALALGAVAGATVGLWLLVGPAALLTPLALSVALDSASAYVHRRAETNKAARKVRHP